MADELFEAGMGILRDVWDVIIAAGAVVRVYLTGEAKYHGNNTGNELNTGIVVIDPAELETMVADYNKRIRDNEESVNLRHAISLDMLTIRHPVTASELARKYGVPEVQLSMLRKEVYDSL